jgi:hypothetical protein
MHKNARSLMAEKSTDSRQLFTAEQIENPLPTIAVQQTDLSMAFFLTHGADLSDRTRAFLFQYRQSPCRFLRVNKCDKSSFIGHRQRVEAK